MKRIYESVVLDHLKAYRQMVFLSGPRQIGKTSLSKACVEGNYPYRYLTWDNVADREVILSGIENICQNFETNILTSQSKNAPVIIFDEIHKYRDWKNMLKGYFDVISERCKIIVTGSAKLNVYRHGGDSMMGRYFLYRIHPLTVAEILGHHNFTQEITAQSPLPEAAWSALLTYGGFPEPYLKNDPVFYKRWIRLKQEQLFNEDLRELSKVHDMARLELLAMLIKHQISGTVKYSELAKKIRVSEPTIRNWVDILQNVFYCFSIKPWTKNVSRSLLKEPKIYLWDWSVLDSIGSKLENLVAVHLQKAAQFWTDIGLGEYELYFLRDKDKHEVDFLVTRENKPWFLVEVKNSSNHSLNPNLGKFQQQIGAEHAFQVCFNLPYVDADCFKETKPIVVPAITFLSQLI